MAKGLGGSLATPPSRKALPASGGPAASARSSRMS